jgi:endonuclease YncB( thermonuclease family)
MYLNQIVKHVKLAGAFFLRLAVLCLLPALWETGCDDGWRVKRVIDGDTVIVATGAGEEKVRLKGVDAPEIPHPDFGRFKSDPYGPESRRCLIDLLDSPSAALGRNQNMVWAVPSKS